MTPPTSQCITDLGFEVLPALFSPAETAAARDACEQATAAFPRSRAGVRNLLRAVPEIRRLAEHHTLMSVIHPVLGPGPVLTRAILFDKTPDANWAVPWHQDTTIAVRERIDAPGFGPWSIKDGVPHVQPPADVLERMLTVRIHLDDCGPENGPLLVLPASHRDGLLSDAAVERWKSAAPPVPCTTPAGGAVLMRPLLLHASPKSESTAHRRIVHLEFASGELPGGLRWHAA